jgi:hypothetical protein
LLGNSHRALLLQQEPDAQKGKLELTLSVQSAEVKVGQPILCKLTLSNTGTKAGVYDPQDYFPFRVLRSAKKDGAANRFIGSVAQTLGADRPIEPGASVVLWDKVDATEFFLIEQGAHVLWAEHQSFRRGPKLLSNEVSVEVSEGKLSYINETVKTLAALAPPHWRIQAAATSIAITYEKSSLKSELESIRVWFTEKPLPDGFELGTGANKQTVATLGTTPKGLAHIAYRARALELWPEAKEKIAGAVIPKAKPGK